MTEECKVGQTIVSHDSGVPGPEQIELLRAYLTQLQTGGNHSGSYSYPKESTPTIPTIPPRHAAMDLPFWTATTSGKTTASSPPLMTFPTFGGANRSGNQKVFTSPYFSQSGGPISVGSPKRRIIS
jgi:hypothetical protein